MYDEQRKYDPYSVERVLMDHSVLMDPDYEMRPTLKWTEKNYKAVLIPSSMILRIYVCSE